MVIPGKNIRIRECIYLHMDKTTNRYIQCKYILFFFYVIKFCSCQTMLLLLSSSSTELIEKKEKKISTRKQNNNDVRLYIQNRILTSNFFIIPFYKFSAKTRTTSTNVASMRFKHLIIKLVMYPCRQIYFFSSFQ